MKKLLGILALAICLILCACGSENAAETVPSAAEEVTAATEVTSAETEATENEGLDAGYYYGTWKVVGIERNGQRFSVEGLEKDGNYLVSNMTLILRDDGKYYFYVGLNTDTAEWVVSETGIVVDGDVMVLEGDTLSLDFTSFIAYFERSSTDTAFPEEKWYTEKDVYGTWKLCGVYTVSDSQYYTLAEVRKANEKLAESYFVFAQDGKGFVRIEDSEQHITCR